MRQAILALLCSALLAVAGSSLAQTDPGTADTSTAVQQSGDTQSTTSTSPATGGLQSGETQSGTSAATGGSESAGTQSGTLPAEGGSMSDTNRSTSPSEDPSQAPGSNSGATPHDRLPKTASPVPLVLAFGLTALAGSAALRAYRLRQAR